MGASIGAALRGAGHAVSWASEGRSPATQTRAEAVGLEDAGSLEDALSNAEVVFSVCPPHAAVELARAVAQLGFRGVFVDANAVSPRTALEVAEVVTRVGGVYVDGGIIGPPVRQRGDTRLYLSGARGEEIAALFHGTALEAIPLDGAVTASSALKMAYAAWTKGSAALLLVTRALARAAQVDAALEAEWRRSLPELPERLERAASSGAKKGWRWNGEMLEVASSFEQYDLPNGFHRAAAEVFERLELFKDADRVGLEQVLEALVGEANASP
jgi:3-hydroxyisobutyrate dehydrogenase-like beta-hydroxyacid dehydrogenase